ncbi:hypothetical protein BD626DRAFT_511754 [Schizophyllum amplum]|uniref:Uncharacterized protein n=1 Tax=Schizophyllum amplum TaxID=97359 RepID=A0A550C0S6_9AGAR|nr:hypothetical protein BD626DRAFT_511754 [Auriculariopsis ampla]
MYTLCTQASKPHIARMRHKKLRVHRGSRPSAGVNACICRRQPQRCIDTRRVARDHSYGRAAERPRPRESAVRGERAQRRGASPITLLCGRLSSEAQSRGSRQQSELSIHCLSLYAAQAMTCASLQTLPEPKAPRSSSLGTQSKLCTTRLYGGPGQ